eukprot:Skav233206  [mRNA]  locus=scaffold1872:40493:42058:- [translate_table: standard]
MLARICRIACTQHLFQEFCHSGRQDASGSGSGVVDGEVAHPWDPRNPWQPEAYDSTILPSPMTGCLPTANRLYQADLLDSERCRFCDHDHEDIQHLTCHCEGVRRILGNPGYLFADQELLYTHGIFQTPQYLLDCIAHANAAGTAPVEQLHSVEMRVWVSAGLGNPDHFFSRTAGWDVYNLLTGEDAQHSWCDPFANKLQISLLAMVYAARRWRGPLVFLVECKSTLRLWDATIARGTVPPGTEFSEILEELMQLARNQPLKVELRPRADFSLELKREPRNNGNDRCFDAIKQAMPLSTATLNSWRHHITIHRAWLCRLSVLLQEQKPSEEQNSNNNIEIEVDANQDLHEEFTERFPRWDWHFRSEDYPWTLSQPLTIPDNWQWGPTMWDTSSRFWQQLRWRINPGAATSIAELAFIFWCRCRVMPPDVQGQTEATYSTLMRWIRMFVAQFAQPGLLIPQECTFFPRKMLRMNQAFGYGLLEGARPHLSQCELTQLAKFVGSLPGHGAKARDWDMGVSLLP